MVLVLLPNQVFLLRDNHETKFCTIAYGFEKEIMVKYGERANSLYQKILTCFQSDSLAIVIVGYVYVAHGRLFRRCSVPTLTPSNNISDSKRFLGHARRSLTLGTLEDQAKASRDVLDPSGVGSNAILSDRHSDKLAQQQQKAVLRKTILK
ncbi:hypothetical protein O6H91_01G125000 [Diphasiastrum complanatum]|uniref:Uncharacterized protein n=1 Tax=Diphasiastrum complanatum TaxID=34168 RepID=A0ACC2EVT8_DIPCM|nr:hypothetical protein O6H91_01G125000 [Diphasiastrum complanatum]